MRDAPLTILHLAANRWWTGSADPTIRLATGLRARGHRVLLAVIPGDRFESKAREAELDLVDGVRLQARLAPVALVRDVLRLRAVVHAHGVDILHAHHSHDHWLALLVRPRRADGSRAAVVRTFHNARSVKRGLVSRALHRRTAAFFAVSRQIETRCREVGLAAARVVWTPGVADLPRFADPAGGAAVREEFKLGDAPVVVSVARLAPNRGHELLLAGFRLLLEDVPSARLLLVGKGETRGRLERLVIDTGLAQHVIFTGYRDRDLPAVLAAADCFALMAAGSDDSCRAALEAMAAGRPVVARAVGALPETVVHGETGVLIADEEPRSVARALRAVLTDPARGRAMGAAGRQRAQAEFSVERSTDIVEGVYRSLA
ncbi:MAG TPA: glycosyltransferase family 4 protein [Methylomirabilota bacterium]|jgi:phosphatidylinositol alpha-1,6-mannosyltransferase|nr:glycosyltransferase family 4 protein [Methylomirabilota bacterium]